VLSEQRPELAIRTATARVWRNNAGLGWTNPYDRRVWRTTSTLGGGRAKAGFDEIQFDYVRFPSDGDLSLIRYPGASAADALDDPRFVQYARSAAPARRARLGRTSSGSPRRATSASGSSRAVSRYVDAVYPMVYPSHYNPASTDSTTRTRSRPDRHATRCSTSEPR
jgi:hypothetical protein